MPLLGLVLIVMVLLALGYVLYGRFISRQYQLDDAATTPAVRREDGVDFVPTRPFYLMGQHFSAIAAAGPIVGPISACLMFGWLPCLLWILLGVVFIGAVHDFSVLVASVRHDARSIADIARQYLGRKAYLALVAFIWLSLLYVIVAFADVTTQSFIGADPDLALIQPGFNRGGAVAMASALYLALALVMGLVTKKWNIPMWLVTLIFVPGTLLMIWLATHKSDMLVFSSKTWYIAILGYCGIASMLPIWLLQQPRGYLGGFVLYLAIGVAALGLLFGGFTVEQPAVKEVAGGWGAWFAGGESAPPMTALLFPFLFVTIACGACSGFHGLVCGGTTSKQIAKESHCKPIGFGCMLLEGFVAVLALATIMMLTPEAAKAIGKPNLIYGEGLAKFVTVLLGDDVLIFAKTFGSMVLATFIFDTLDVTTRLGRYLLQELFNARGAASGVVATALTITAPLAILWTAKPGSWIQYWTLFGTANQLLAALSLLSITVWLRRSGRACWYTLWPTVFVAVVTVCALMVQITQAWRFVQAKGWSPTPEIINGCAAVLLALLAAFYIIEAVRNIKPRPA